MTNEMKTSIERALKNTSIYCGEYCTVFDLDVAKLRKAFKEVCSHFPQDEKYGFYTYRYVKATYVKEGITKDLPECLIVFAYDVQYNDNYAIYIGTHDGYFDICPCDETTRVETDESCCCVYLFNNRSNIKYVFYFKAPAVMGADTVADGLNRHIQRGIKNNGTPRISSPESPKTETKRKVKNQDPYRVYKILILVSLLLCFVIVGIPMLIIVAILYRRRLWKDGINPNGGSGSGSAGGGKHVEVKIDGEDYSGTVYKK